MKLNIEELAREAARKATVVVLQAAEDGRTISFKSAELQELARLIVERCAQECEQLPLPDGINPKGVMPSSAWETGTIDAAAAIRNLMED